MDSIERAGTEESVTPSRYGRIMKTTTQTPPIDISPSQERRHRSELELWFAELGLEVTEVERCPDPACELCADAVPAGIDRDAAAEGTLPAIAA